MQNRVGCCKCGNKSHTCNSPIRKVYDFTHGLSAVRMYPAAVTRRPHCASAIADYAFTIYFFCVTAYFPAGLRTRPIGLAPFVLPSLRRLRGGLWRIVSPIGKMRWKESLLLSAYRIPYFLLRVNAEYLLNFPPDYCAWWIYFWFVFTAICSFCAMHVCFLHRAPPERRDSTLDKLRGM